MKSTPRNLLWILAVFAFNLDAATAEHEVADAGLGPANIEAIPLPIIIWLIGTLIIGLVALRRRVQAKSR